MKPAIFRTFLTICLISALSACVGWHPDQQELQSMNGEVNTTITRFKQQDPSLQAFFDQAYGYAVFPTIGKGGFWIGGAHGKGEVFERGRLVGTTTMTQVTVGPQIGGQAYSEIIFFKDKPTLDQFKAGNYTFNAQISAVAATAGAAKNANYSNGVAVFSLTEGGLMAEATIGGQKFSFEPIQSTQ